MTEDRIKQRLTGAAIVVALMVLLVPEMFRGRPPAAQSGGAPAAAGPPLRSYTIDLQDRGTPAAPQAAAPAPGEAPAAGGGNAPAPGPEPVAATGAAPSEVSSAASAPPASVPPASSPTSSAAAATAAEGDGAEATGRYQVQLGLFASRANADRLAERATREGVRVLVSGPDARGLHRVHTPGFRSRAEAEAIQQKLRALGLSTALTPQR